MTPLVNHYRNLGFKPAFDITDSQHEHLTKERLNLPPHRWFTVPGTSHYIPPLIPTDPDWLENVQNVVHLSFMALIADVWTQLLVRKRDAKEKPLYLFWDEDVPLPNPLTSLAWLLTCEIWPLPNHRKDSTVLFPPQPFLLPQGTQLGDTGTPVHGYSYGFIASGQQRPLGSLFAECLNREDRVAMADSPHKHPIFVPKGGTCIGMHDGIITDLRYENAARWPHTSAAWYHQGYGLKEIQESHWSHDQLARLRKNVMSAIGLVPGLPTHPHNLHNVVGQWIRSWSERNLFVKNPPTGYTLKWTPEGDSIKLEHGKTLTHVPHAMPRTWFGFTNFGNIEQDKEHASTRWAATYLRHREQALRMLFHPEGVDLMQLVNDQTLLRGSALTRAGRIRKGSQAKTDHKTSFAAAFNSLFNPDSE